MKSGSTVVHLVRLGFAAVALGAGLASLYVVSPGYVTDSEFRLFLAAVAVAIVVAILADWAHRGSHRADGSSASTTASAGRHRK